MENNPMQPRTTSVGSTTANVQNVNATAGGLVKATLGAAAVAGAILTLVWLPAEHGIDPTGVGHLLGLTEMGHIKEQLHVQADADAAATLAAVTAQPLSAPAAAATNGNATTGDTNEAIMQKLEAMQMQLDSIASTVGATAVGASVVETTVENASALQATPNEATPTETTPTTPVWKDEVAYSLTPGEGIEVKLVMVEGAIAEFEWTANGAVVNHDTHGDGSGQSISYEKGRSVPGQSGQLTAAFTGNHGWYWRNRTGQDVVVTLRTSGGYSGMVLP